MDGGEGVSRGLGTRVLSVSLPTCTPWTLWIPQGRPHCPQAPPYRRSGQVERKITGSFCGVLGGWCFLPVTDSPCERLDDRSGRSLWAPLNPNPGTDAYSEVVWRANTAGGATLWHGQTARGQRHQPVALLAPLCWQPMGTNAKMSSNPRPGYRRPPPHVQQQAPPRHAAAGRDDMRGSE